MKLFNFISFLVLIGFVTACTTSQSTSQPTNQATPTLNPLFVNFETKTPSPKPITTENTSLSSPQPISPTPPIASSQIITTTLYDDALNSNWQILDTDGVTGDLSSTDEVHNGRYAIAMSPSKDLSTFYFAVRPDAQETYPQDQVIAISFWLNGGNDFIAPEDLGIAIIGSNDYPYWVEGDKSVYIDDEFPFSETRLYYLDIHNSFPAHTWVQVIVTLDDLIFDPIYNFVTGFYIKNNEGFYNTVYMDDIELIRYKPDAP